jgi:hypothetical protein
MADYYDQFSEMIQCETVEQANWLLARLRAAEEDDEFGPICESDQKHEESEPNQVWIYSEMNCDMERLADLLCEFQKHFGLQEPIVISWAATCSKPRLDGFGGGAVCIVGGEATWFNARRMADELAEKRVPK